MSSRKEDSARYKPSLSPSKGGLTKISLKSKAESNSPKKLSYFKRSSIEVIDMDN
jgi:hypothetical protein